MVLIISGIILGLCILGFLKSLDKGWEAMTLLCFFIGFATVAFGFILFGTMFPVETEITIPQGAFIEKNESSIVLVVPNVGNKVITDPAIIRYIEIGDTIKVRREYNSYGIELDKTRIYVEKKGWKY
jgi:hypothetical protein